MQDRVRILAIVVGFLLLGACAPPEVDEAPGAAGGPALEARGEDAPRAAGEVPERFEFLGYSVDVESAAPGICLRFSEALDPAADYTAYVARRSGEAMALQVDGQRLCIGGFAFASPPELVLREGLPAASGRVLAQEETLAVEFAERPAYVGFAGDGVVLPRRDADGLGIVTVNVDAVRVAISRVGDRGLAFKRITAGGEYGENRWGYAYGADRPDDLAEPVWSGELDTAGAGNVPITTVLPIAETIGRLAPGAYFVALEDARFGPDSNVQPARAHRWLVITDLALTAYRGATGLDLLVRSLDSAASLADVRVELIARNNERLGRATTDAAGRVRFDAPLLRGTGPLSPRYLFAYAADGDFAVLDLDRNPLDLSAQDVGGRGRPEAADGFVWLDRGIYRPGETLHVGAMIRDERGRALVDRPGSLRLLAPNGLEVDSHRFDDAVAAGTVHWTKDLAPTAARGRWRVLLDLDGVGTVGQAALSVEDFVPQRVALELDANDAVVGAGEVRTVDADVRFLYGAPGAGLDVRGRVRVERDPAPFPEWPGFRFGRHDDPFTDLSRELQETVADGAGRARVPVSLGDAAPVSTVPLRLRTVVTVTEPGGRAVADDVRMPYRPNPRYLGLRAPAEGRVPVDAPSTFEVLAVDAAGAAVVGRVRWTLTRHDSHYDWFRSRGGDWQWRRSAITVPIEDGVVGLDAAPGAIDLAALPWGTYELRADAGDGAAASLRFQAGWRSRSADGSSAPDRVEVDLAESPVRVGERATLAIRAPYAGPAELVVASDRVLQTRALDLVEGVNEVSLPVDAAWGAGAYAMVTVFTPRDPVARPVPRRAVGVAHLPVDVSERTLAVDLAAPERLRPRTQVSIDVHVPAAAGADAAFVTLAAVDEGILALTRFATPDPHAHYFGKQALGVDVLDDYGRLLDPNLGAAAAVRSGGDAIGGAGLTVVPTRSVALHSGPVALEDGRARVELDVPDFQGELRLMAVAWTPDALGSHAQPLTVRDPAVAELVLPRFLAPGDRASATLSIDNVELATGAFRAEVSSQGPLDAGLEADEEIDAGERVDRAVALAAEAVGIGAVDLSVAGPDGFAVARSYDLETRSAWLPATTLVRRALDPGQRFALSPETLAPYRSETVETEFSVAPTPLDLAPLLGALDRYPYGCTEQLVSRALPLVYADRFDDGSDARRTPVQDAIETLLARQAGDGSFGLWRVGDVGATPWLGVYATDFLARARGDGHAVPRAALDRALGMLERIARGSPWDFPGYRSSVHQWSRQDDSQALLLERSAAYAVYVLAREGRADTSRLRYLHDERLMAIPSPLARAHIGAGLAAIGDRARSANAFRAAEAAIGLERRGDWYQSALRDLAGVVALAAEAEHPELAARLVERLAEELPEPTVMTTQEQAFTLLAAADLAGDVDAGALRWGPAVEYEGPVAALGHVRGAAGAADAWVDNAGPARVWVTQRVVGDTVAAPVPVAEGLAVDKRLYRPDGTALPAGDAIDVAQGESLLVVLDVAPDARRMIPAIVVDLLPPGFEIEARLVPQDAGAQSVYGWLGSLDRTNVQEARDDRYVAAIDLRDGDDVRLAYLVRAVTPGTFTLPGAVVEDMYRPDVFGRSSTGTLRVVPRSAQ